MEQLEIKNLKFKYPLRDEYSINGVNLTIKSGEYVVICGKSGCGKTTLLRNIKPSLAPNGTKEGDIFIDSKNVDNIDLKTVSQKVGYVLQDPESQIVTDKVWHELSFGLENLGMSDDEISLRVAEMASYFGIRSWFNKRTDELSGGQMQLLNLASVMAMHPDIIILDEPVSQLDPISAGNFLSTVEKINREIGTTVIITEHRLEEIYPSADRVVLMDNGKIIFDDSPENVGNHLTDNKDFLYYSVPSAVRIFSEFSKDDVTPITVRQGKDRLRSLLGDKPVKNSSISVENNNDNEYILQLKDVFFRYSKNDIDILNNLSWNIEKNKITAIMGGNGTGKSTLLKVIGGIIPPYMGKIKVNGKNINKYKSKELYNKNIGFVPQQVKTLFTSKTLFEDFKQVCSDEDRIKSMCDLAGISNLLSSHPFDLSGGEQQRAGIVKVLLTEPEILLFDEPTKGMDSEFKIVFADILSKLKNNGCTIIMVSHDIEFCAKYCDKCAMMFDGKIVACKETRSFFSDNNFYTTSACRISRDYFKNAITDEDVIFLIKENV